MLLSVRWTVALALALGTPTEAEDPRAGYGPRASVSAAGQRAAGRAVAGQVVDGQGVTGTGSDPASLHAPADDGHVAFRRGLEYLAAQQRATGDFSFPRAGGQKHLPVALAALGALAYMSSGSTPGRGPWGVEVGRTIDFLLSHAEMTDPAELGYIARERGDVFGMHAHGYATLALAQAYTMAPSNESERGQGERGQRIATTLRAATALIERCQTVEGGWFYEPIAGVDHENSVTVVQLQALRAARNCGVHVDSAVIARAIEYIRRCQDEDGQFRYALDPTVGRKPSLALTAAGLATLQNAGHYEGPEVSRAVEAMWREIVDRTRSGESAPVGFPHYERLYVGLALWTHTDRRLFDEWASAECARVVRDQRPDGSWPDEQFGACYATAMNCLFLSIEDGLLPLFER